MSFDVRVLIHWVMPLVRQVCHSCHSFFRVPVVKWHISNQTPVNPVVPAIHASIFYCLSMFRSWGRQSEQRRPDFPHPGYLFKLVWTVNPKAIPKGLSQGFVQVGHAWNTSSRRRPGWWMWRSSDFIPSRITKLFTLSLCRAQLPLKEITFTN